MSADNWSQCPQCIRTMKVRFENFKSEFYGKLSPESFLRNLRRIQKKD